MRRRQRACHQPHGTNARYVAGCSCIECCDAHREYIAEYKRGANRTVDAAPVRAHLAKLYAQGYSRRSIASSAQVSYGALRLIDGSTPMRNGKYTQRVRIENAEAILALDKALPADHGGWLPVEETRALVARMRERGFTRQRIADAAGVSDTAVYDVLNRTERISARIALGFQDAAQKLGVTRPRIDFERYDQYRAEGMCVEDAAECAGINDRAAWRHENQEAS